MENQVREMATLIGDPVRALTMWKLMEGKGLTASELATCVGTSPQNISNHLSKLVRANLLAVESQGRYRYYRFARPEAAYLMEALSALIPHHPGENELGKSETHGIRYCRSCYDHLAGKVGVMIADQLVKQRIVRPKNNQYEVTSKGVSWFDDLGLSVEEIRRQKRSFSRQCLDWSERRYHISGALGAALLSKMLTAKWVVRMKDSRALIITSQGQIKLYEMLGVNV